MFYDDGTVRQKWEAHPNAVTVSAQANLSLTTCYQGTSSCHPDRFAFPRDTNAVVDTRFEFIQLDPTGHACRIHPWASRHTILDDAHHYAASYARPNLPIDATCGTRTFMMRIYVKHVSGQTVKIDGTQLGATSLTNGIAFNNF
ncbi:hypothetical protein ACFVIM_03055 [Streptomyces sp. NPDC057638]|uniref:hypothetical protein n=1 Tax=Streptomyces sp. NPDC057638 TaxID=3346190 RepID=UPI003675D2F8